MYNITAQDASLRIWDSATRAAGGVLAASQMF